MAEEHVLVEVVFVGASRGRLKRGNGGKVERIGPQKSDQDRNDQQEPAETWTHSRDGPTGQPKQTDSFRHGNLRNEGVREARKRTNRKDSGVGQGKSLAVPGSGR